ncbi:hypothetical protein AVEN_22824-1 [Araneus ventricosus]|uniref:HTH psq-type domain-containing protein n=1 Tax=Araneus ventricosus TaxID=182803 RepID=A0A4Y2TKJ3_ARAVE|nr:hypothetical protein AVEN_22824-1 [Araneus ventricosus]
MEPSNRKLVFLSVEQKFKIVSRIGAGETFTKLSKEFGVGVSTVGERRRDSEKNSKSFMQRPMANQNCDETGLYWRAIATKTLTAENEAVAPGRAKMKDRVKILGCPNATGSYPVKLTCGKE